MALSGTINKLFKVKTLSVMTVSVSANFFPFWIMTLFKVFLGLNMLQLCKMLIKALTSVVLLPGNKEKKLALLEIINTLFKVYFQLNTLRLCKTLINAVNSKQFLDFDMFPASQRVTYRYYTGRLNIFDERYVSPQPTFHTAGHCCCPVWYELSVPPHTQLAVAAAMCCASYVHAHHACQANLCHSAPLSRRFERSAALLRQHRAVCAAYDVPSGRTAVAHSSHTRGN